MKLILQVYLVVGSLCSSGEAGVFYTEYGLV
jgi:hypothetical protein